jgi:hypothetical protein
MLDSVHLESVNVGAKWVHSLRQTYQRLKNHFGHTWWYSYMMRLKWKLDSVHLEIVLSFTQDRSSVCVERTRGLENHFVHTGWNY